MESFQGRTVKLWGCTVTAIFEIDVFDIYKLRDVFQENFLDFWRKGYKKHDEIWLREIFRAKTQKARKHPLNLITLERTRLTLISDIQVSFPHNRVRDFVKKSCTILPHDFSWRNTLKGCSSHHWKDVDFVDIYIGSSGDLSNPHPVGQWQLAIRIPLLAKAPALCKPLPSPKSTFFFSGGETRPRPTRPTGRR